MDTWRQNSSVVSKFRVNGNFDDALAARLCFERLFSAANFEPAGLPSTAIICIRKLSAPALARQISYQDFQLSPDWQSGVQREIEKLFRRAYRPIRETVPAQAESIVFADKSELLACLASDWTRSLLAQHWWWRSLFPNLGNGQTIEKIWAESAEFAPPALLLLAKTGGAVKFAVNLQPIEARDLLFQIIQTFGLRKIQRVFFESFGKTQKSFADSAENFTGKQFLTRQNKGLGEIQKLAPWFYFVPEARQISLGFERQSLLGIVLMLARVPQIVRTAEFAVKLKNYRRELEFYQRKLSLKAPEISNKPKKAKKTLIPTAKTLPPQKGEKIKSIFAETKDETQKSVTKQTTKTVKNQVTFEEIPTKTGVSGEISPSEAPRIAEKTAKRQNKDFDKKQKIEINPEIPIAKKEKKSPPPSSQIGFQNYFLDFEEATGESSEITIETRFGGVFYFLNLGLYLNLYRDFTETGDVELDLNIWDFVALLGFAFLGEKLKADAVWQFLKDLAGHKSDEDFGKDFVAPHEWRIPADWLKTFQTNEQWLWKTVGKRLLVRHPAGFSVIDVRLAGDLEIQLKDELKVYGEYFSEIAGAEFKGFPATFLENLNEYVEKRLRQALNLQENEQIAEILLERRATVAMTATHLDITFRLADLPFAVRLSGLDRDAGWIPAAGRFVKFHFV